ncbi:SEC14-like protein 2 [Daphnia carinata]|uniref:SEC14-like protein 2 n=1 Tax=Daphnia carinata TaxID=120202 RepID=UPI00257C4365|nr:SEC14-like protein 2 [Daphnia carinata]
MSVMDTQMTQRSKFDEFFYNKNDFKHQDCNGNYDAHHRESNSGLTKEEINAVRQLRMAIGDCKLHDPRDEFLLKWITAGSNIAHAEQMLRQTLEWRRLNGVDEILDTFKPSEVFQKYFPEGEVGVDKFGCPVFIHTTGRLDLRGLLSSSTKKEFKNFLIWLTEKYVRAIGVASERIGKTISKCTFIFDQEALQLNDVLYKPGIDFAIEFTKLMSAYYPDYPRRIFIINVPSYFAMIYSISKSFIPECDALKIKLFGNNKNEWMPALLEEIDADQLPAHYGGTMTDPDGDPKCPSKVVMGGKVPHSYYLCNKPPMAKDYMETVNIMAGGSGRKKLKFKVDIAGSAISWEFMTEGGDIGFRVYSKDSKGRNDLIPPCRVDSHLVMEEGQVICNQPGNYVFEFDNTHSYLRGKKVRYHIALQHSNA